MTETPWTKTAKDLLNTKEIEGRGNNPLIVGWAKKIGGWVAKYYTSDDIPWCGLFVGHCLNANNIKVPPDMLAAIAWNKYGRKLDSPKYGCIAIWRWAKGNHHVSFIIGQTKDYYLALGGNQSNKVNIQKYPKSALIGSRWPEVDLQPQELPNA